MVLWVETWGLRVIRWKGQEVLPMKDNMVYFKKMSMSSTHHDYGRKSKLSSRYSRPYKQEKQVTP